MIDEIAKKIVELKQEFAKTYSGNSHIQELIPISSSKEFLIDDNHLKYLHNFALKNPIYHNSYEQNFGNILTRVYEGDINEYWLNSIKHGSSCQPFYPTWIFSAYIATQIAKNFNFKELVDVGSGDGRIAYCAKFLGLHTISIEIDDALIELQKTISSSTNVNFNPVCADALELDYSSLKLTHPVFFIGGLPQMGGDILASSIIEKISLDKIKDKAGIVFAGTQSKKQLSSNLAHGGWSSLIDKHGLIVTKTISLPTIWTFDQLVDTPYIYTEFN